MGQDSIGKRSPAPSSNDSNGNKGDRGSEFPAENLNGLQPTTTSGSKLVMLAAERRDRIEVNSTIEKFFEGDEIPDRLTVLKRSSTYYGPKILAHAQISDKEHNFLITAPGPASELILWVADTDEDNYRKSWYRLAEVEVNLAEDQPSFDVCSQCNSPIRSVEHERMASLGMCDQ
jgi:hypothetical protein